MAGRSSPCCCRPSGQDALATALRARQAIAALDLINRSGASAPVTVSIGFAISTQLYSEEAFLLEADDALYRAKRRGRDRVEGEATGMPETEGNDETCARMSLERCSARFHGN